MNKEDKFEEKAAKVSLKTEDKIEKAFIREAKDKDLAREQALDAEASNIAFGMSPSDAEKQRNQFIQGANAQAEQNCMYKVDKILDKAERKSETLDRKYNS